MRVVALLSWIVTAGLGAFMLRTWLARDGLRRERAKVGGLPPPLIFGHATAALVGLVTWASFVVTGLRPLAWTALCLLMVAVSLGLCTVILWTPYPARKPGERRTPARERPEPAHDRPGSAPEPAAKREGEVTDEMISQFFTQPPPEERERVLMISPAVIIPAVHGFMALATFTLAMMSAVM